MSVPIIHDKESHLVSVHELVTDDVLTDAGGRNKVVKLIEKFHTALMILRSRFTQLIPQQHCHTLHQTRGSKRWVKRENY